MFIFLNALKNLLRNKGKNILVSIVLLIMMTATTVSLAVSAMSDKMIGNYKEGFGVEATIIVDWSYIWANSKEIPIIGADGSEMAVMSGVPTQITFDEHIIYGNSPYVMEFLMSGYASYASDLIKPTVTSRYETSTLEEVMATFNVTNREDLRLMGVTDEHLASMVDSKPNGVGLIYGYSDISMMRDFRRGEKRLVEGRMIESKGETLISDKLAAHNNVKLGDTIPISGGSKTQDHDIIYLSVAGIFEDLKTGLAPRASGIIEMNAGTDDLIVSNETLMDSGIHRINPGIVIYYLNDPEAVDLFLDDCRAKGLHENYTLDYDIESYNAIVEPVKDMSGVAVTSGIVILITGAAVLVFLSIINIRDRKYEVGVLRAIGMKKHQIARSMVYESLSLKTICTLIGIPLGSLVSKPIAEILLDSSDIVNMAVSLNPQALVIILVVAALLGTLSSIIGIFYITKCEPMKILQERN